MVTGLPLNRDDMIEVIMNKDATHEEVYAKYGTHRGKKGVVISKINDLKVQFSMLILAFKILHKCHKDEYPLVVIFIVKQCIEGVKIDWEIYLQNEFIQDFLEA
jgi:hypothetical protein